MGVVWSARHISQAFPVAVKILKEQEDPEAFLRVFRKEVRSVAGLNHPHIIRVFDSGTLDVSIPLKSGGRLPARSRRA